MHRRGFFYQIAGLATLPWWAKSAFADDEVVGWKQVLTDQGIAVWNRYEPGRDLPVFKGIGNIDAGLFECLAVLDDTPRFVEWQYNCVGARVLRQLNEFDRIVYNRTDAPWPVSDRDVVLQGAIEANLARKEVISRFGSINSSLQPVIDGVVRMPRLRGMWKFVALDDRHTRATFQIDADPGGSLPDFVIERASRRLPLETIAGMRRQTAKMRGRYTAFLQKYDPASGGKIPEQFLR